MANRQARSVLAAVEILLRNRDERTDGDLLREFLDTKAEDAFAVLVRRHGPMVWGVCRRILGNLDDADDAAQATFLVLATKVNACKGRASLGDWLYGVARRTALGARRSATRRRELEKRIARSVVQEENDVADVLPILDEELARLPEKYRLPIVLCDLEGQSRKQAALQLRWPEGSVASRLVRGRQLLAERLTKRGVSLTATALAAALAANDVAAIVSAATLRIVAAATQVMSSGSLSKATVVSAKVLALTQGVLKTMLLSKLKLVAAFAFVSLGLAWGIGWIVHGSVVAQTGRAENVTAKQIVDSDDKKAAPAVRPADAPSAARKEDPKVVEILEKLKRNLDGIPQFACRFTVSNCFAPNLDDALKDRNLEREPVAYGLWLVQKPKERYVLVSDKKMFENWNYGLPIVPDDPLGPIQNGLPAKKVWANHLSDGVFTISVTHDSRIGIMTRGFPDISARSYAGTFGTPLEGTMFDYSRPDAYLKSTDKHYAKFAGISPEGHWQIDTGWHGEPVAGKNAFDPTKGFLPVRIAHAGLPGGAEKGWFIWYATHFQKIGDDRWLTTRSLSDETWVTKRVDGKQGTSFREFKVDLPIVERKEPDLSFSIAVESGFKVMYGDNGQQHRESIHRGILYNELPKMWNTLPAGRKKDETPAPIKSARELFIGEWKLAATRGPNHNGKPFEDSNRRLSLIFTDDKVEYREDAALFDGVYKLDSAKQHLDLMIDPLRDMKVLFRIEGDDLYITSGNNANVRPEHTTPAGDTILQIFKRVNSVDKKPPGDSKEARDAAVRRNRLLCGANLHRIVFAMWGYHEAHGAFPAAARLDQAGKPLLSWRVAILPYLGEKDLYDQFRQVESWDSEHNHKLLAKMPKIYASLGNQPKVPHATYYQVFVGEGTVFEPGKKVVNFDILGGTPNTLAIVTATDAVPWTKPADLSYRPGQKLPSLVGGMFDDGLISFASVDGSVHRAPNTLDEDFLRMLILRNNQFRIDFDALRKLAGE